MRQLNRLRAGSLRRTLLLVLMPAMLLVLGLELWQTWRTAHEAANAAYDRSLYGAIKSIDANISTASGGLGVELPYRMLEFFELTASGQVFYRVATEDGLVEIGNADLPAPPPVLVSGQPEFRDALYYGDAIRIGSFAREISPPLAGQAGRQRVVIQVAESMAPRNAFKQSFLLKAVARDVLVLLLGMGVVMAGVAWALVPLRSVRQEVAARLSEDLTPIPSDGVPKDVLPLIDAINLHMERNRQQSQALRQFIDDASHQLRTPLTTLATQVSYALRESDARTQRETLHAIKAQLDETIRQTNQMLALARTDSAEINLLPVDLRALAEATTRSWWQAARAQGQDLGFQAESDAIYLPADAGLLREALSNLLHNALQYTPRGGQITVLVSQTESATTLAVQDDGPGIAPDELPRAGQRFFRGSNGGLPGSGLGLAIVQAIAQRHGGSLRLQPGPNGRGLHAALVFAHPPHPGAHTG